VTLSECLETMSECLETASRLHKAWVTLSEYLEIVSKGKSKAEEKEEMICEEVWRGMRYGGDRGL